MTIPSPGGRRATGRERGWVQRGGRRATGRERGWVQRGGRRATGRERGWVQRGGRRDARGNRGAARGGYRLGLGDVTVEDESAPGTVETPAGVSIGTSATSPSRTNPRRGRWNPPRGVSIGTSTSAKATLRVRVRARRRRLTGSSRRRLWWRTPAAASTLIRARTWTTTRPRRRSSGWTVPPPRRARDRSAPFWRAERSARAWWTTCWNFAFLRQRASDLRGKEATTLLSSAPASIRANVSPDAMSSLADACEAPVRVLRRDARVARSSSARARALSRQTRGAVGGEGRVGGETVGRARGRGRATRGDAVASVAGGGAGGDDETRVEGRQIDGGGFRVQTVRGTRDERHRGDQHRVGVNRRETTRARARGGEDTTRGRGGGRRRHSDAKV